ncbi:MAG TPA: hypothetical protein PLO59_06390, partial [Bacteroidia bacterium]|nr:hypothetical protein [Bacteroidia bacterium]
GVISFINDLDNKPQQKIMWALHNMFVSYPQISGKVKFNIPFYYHTTWVCYLKPIKPDAVEVCFMRGFDIQLYPKILLSKNRSMVKGITVTKLTPKLMRQVETVFIEAIEVAKKTPFSVAHYKQHKM